MDDFNCTLLVLQNEILGRLWGGGGMGEECLIVYLVPFVHFFISFVLSLTFRSSSLILRRFVLSLLFLLWHVDSVTINYLV